MATRRSAGVLLHRPADGAPEVLLVHPGGPWWAKKDLGAWSIPKGAVRGEGGPSGLRAAGVGEELGSPPPIDPTAMVDLGEVRQRGGKVVRCFAAAGDFDPATLCSNTFMLEWPPRSGAEREFPEVDRAEWLVPDAARQKIIEAQAPFVDRLLDHLGFDL